MTTPLKKTILTDADYEHMSWHDVVVHGLLVHPEKWEIILDIDYILEWFEPETSGVPYSFSIAPATLIFHDVNGLEINYQFMVLPLQILSIVRENPRKIPGRNLTEWQWNLHLVEGGIGFKATGFSQYFRNHPTKSSTGYLEPTLRGGLCFDRTSKSK